MNAEILAKLLQAKRLEVEALALLVPDSARQGAATVIRACSSAVLSILSAPEHSTDTAQSAAKHQQDHPSDVPLSRSALRPIVIE